MKQRNRLKVNATPRKQRKMDSMKHEQVGCVQGGPNNLAHFLYAL